MLTVAQTTQNIWNFMVGKLSLQEIGTLAIIREISDSALESGRYGTKSGVSQIIWESWQHCIKNFLIPKSENVRPHSSNSMENATPL